jgi:N-acetyl-anhydromuramyl-L-alanine amidase AmpD
MYHKSKINTKYSNYSKRNCGIEVDTIVIHYTQLGFKDSYRILTQSGKVSSHFLISEKGEVCQLVPLDYKAWHAGISCWRGKSDVNQNSIGIEIVNWGMELKFLKDNVQVLRVQKFYNAQYFALAKVIDKLKKLYPKITDRNIVGHSDITAKTLRKVDPGIAFDWGFLNLLGHGVYHEVEEGSDDNNEVVFKLGDEGKDVKLLQRRLQDIGYEVELNGIFDGNLANAIFAFELHYFQHNIKKSHSIGYGKWYKVFDNLILKLVDSI